MRANEIHRGLALKFDDELYAVVETSTTKPGKGGSFVRAKLKSLKTGMISERRLRSDETVEDVFLERRKAQYLYKDATGFVFMDQETYEQYRVGGRLTCARGGWTAVGEYVRARDGTLDRWGWYAQLSCKLTLRGFGAGENYVTSIEPVARYNELVVDLPHSAGDPLTWDRRTLTLGALVQVAKGTMVKVEYNFNGEETGAGSVDNDELLVQLEVKF